MTIDPILAVDRADALGRDLLDDIPLARAMALTVTAYDVQSLTLFAPLAPNVNDKGCAFGGSLASLMTLAGWGLAKLGADARGIESDIYVQDSTIRYLAPVWQDFSAVARPAENERLDDFLDTLASRGKARLRVVCRVSLDDGSAAATLEARFVGFAKR